MSRHKNPALRVFLIALLATLPLVWTGCAHEPRPPAERPAVVQNGKKVAFLGFKAAQPVDRTTDVIRDPFSGSLFSYDPVPPEAIDRLNRMIMNHLVLLGDNVIPPEESGDFLSSEMGKDIQAKLTLPELYREVGRAMETDGVLFGHVYRWNEREGTNYAVDRPASAAFDLNLVRSSDGALVWRGKFDRTQRSLSENMFDFFRFFKRGARWLEVEEFAASGLEDMFRNYPATMPPER